MSLRALAAEIGLSYALIHQFLDGKRVRESTVARIERWLDSPSNEATAGQLLSALGVVLKDLPSSQQRALRRRLADEFDRAYRRQGVSPPAWIESLRRR
jgi:hypothetical protein